MADKFNFERVGIAALVFLVFLTAGCRTTKQYVDLARAGTTYAAALDALLESAANTSVDATSERLLLDKKLVNPDLETYQKFSSLDKERLEIIKVLHSHVRLMGRYFNLLYDLASSDAPEQAGQSMSGIIDNLNLLGNQLRQSALVSNKGAFSIGSKLVVGAIVRRRLKDELNARKETIQEELNTQAVLLNALSEAIKHDLAIIGQAREQRLVLDPLLGNRPIERPDNWIKNRRTVLTSNATVAQLDSATNAIHQLRQAFEDLVEGKLTIGQVSNLVVEFQSILSRAVSIKH